MSGLQLFKGSHVQYVGRAAQTKPGSVGRLTIVPAVRCADFFGAKSVSYERPDTGSVDVSDRKMRNS